MLYTLKNKELTIKVNSLGAELQSILHKNSQRELLWQANPQFWTRRAPVLFPMVGRLKNDNFYYQKKKYSLKQHGFARDTEFSLKKSSQNSLTFQLKSNHTTLENYPFEFVLEIKYTLKANAITIEYLIKNPTDNTLYFSIGSHEAFNLPLELNQYQLEFPQDQTLTRYFLDNGLQNGKTEKIKLENNRLNLSSDTFSQDALIFKKTKSKIVTLYEKDKALLQYEFTNFPYLALWSKNDAPFVCLEAWAGLSDSLDSQNDWTQKEGIISLTGKMDKKLSHKLRILLK